MKKKPMFILLFLFTLVFVVRSIDFNLDFEETEEKSNLKTFINDQGEIKLYFCPQDNCEDALVNFIDSAKKSIHCALFDIGLESVQNVLDKKIKEIEVKIVTDNDYVHKFNRSFVKVDSWGLQHNKFCIIDGKKISTGSMNPTNNGAHKNNNNLLLIESKVLANNYDDEFMEMWNGTFKKGDNVKTPYLKLDDNTSIANFFCPEDNCAYHVKEELKKAQKSIHFMIFSFTHDGIANIILLKHLDNLTIKGVMEARQVTKYSKYEVLKYQGIDVIKDSNPNNLHHKVFIIDNETVITGSFNPSAGGNTRNDENILIIKNKEIAKKFIEEFDNVRN
jgi:phosphatidylserine/phosphatidylglycerophosphate/cardiolipin synthase-like enzyme